MLALDDQALAHLFISATAVSQRQRARWVRSVARELEGQAPTAGAQRSRKFRRRQHSGLAVYRTIHDRVVWRHTRASDVLRVARCAHEH